MIPLEIDFNIQKYTFYNNIRWHKYYSCSNKIKNMQCKKSWFTIMEPASFIYYLCFSKVVMGHDFIIRMMALVKITVVAFVDNFIADIVDVLTDA